MTQRGKRVPYNRTQASHFASGVANKGLLYLHTKEKGKVALHGDVKSTNIVVDGSYSPKLIDFCMAHYYLHQETIY